MTSDGKVRGEVGTKYSESCNTVNEESSLLHMQIEILEEVNRNHYTVI